MDERSQSHATWDCKYHVVFASKYRTKRLYGDVRRELGDLLHNLARQKGCEIREGHLMPDHVHMLISIPPKYSVSSIVGFLKGKTALYVANKYARKRRYKGYHFGRVGTSSLRLAMMSRSSDVISVVRKRPTKLPTLPTCLTVATNL